MEREDVLREFARHGVSIAAWARQEGFSAPLVYQVLRGARTCTRGQSHEIAVALGLKAGAVGGLGALERTLQRKASPNEIAPEPSQTEGGKQMKEAAN